MKARKPAIADDRAPALHILVIAVLTIACLIPFTDKAFHIDDPLFIWAARRILVNPFDFYGFSVNWYGTVSPMADVMKNPPLAGYYIAVAASAAGWGERALHIFFIVPAVAVTVGSYFIARRFTGKPLLSGLLAVATPVFLLSATTLMSDMLMLAFWNWAVVLWVRGTDREKPLSMFLSVLLIAMSALTKYFGASLIPLLAAYSLFARHRFIKWAPWLLVPVAILAGYQWATHEMYGRGLLSDAAVYAGNIRDRQKINLFENGLIGAVFAGGCLIVTLFYAPFVWGRWGIIAGILLIAIGAFMLAGLKGFGVVSLMGEAGTRWDLIAEIILFAIAGINLICISAADFIRRRDPSSLLLGLWLMGTFAFAAFFNWTVSGRTILPMVPAAAILLARAIEDGGTRNPFALYMPLIPGLLLALSVTWADYSFANSARTAAGYINAKYGKDTGAVWFEGHWGFQYYMEKDGAKAIDFARSSISEGDTIVMPLNNTNLRRFPGDVVGIIEEAGFPSSGFLTTMRRGEGAGFYASGWGGPLPYMASSAQREGYVIMYAMEDIALE